jgi:uncharacterized protein YkwD
MRWAWALVLAASFASCAGEEVSPFTSGTDTDADTDGDSDTDTDAGDPAEACDPSAASWPSASAALEAQVVELVNEARAEGADCGDAGVFGVAEPLVMEPHLQCAARVHSLDMGTQNYFSHESPDGPLGDNQWERVASAGYEGFLLDENIAAGKDNAEETVEMWLASGEQCAKIMNPGASETGVGFASVDGSVWTNYWTQEFGAP